MGRAMVKDKEYGYSRLRKVYYLHRESNTSQWEKPTDGSVDYSNGTLI
jgi:hypothetical protein